MVTTEEASGRLGCLQDDARSKVMFMDDWYGRRPKVLNSAIEMVILGRSCPELTQYKDVRRVVMVCPVIRE